MDNPELTAAVHVEGLSKVFRQRSSSGTLNELHAVRDVSFTVPAGQCLGIVGESGSGKSTVARMLVGLEEPSSGSIWLGGHPVPKRLTSSDRHAHARRVQMVFQDPYASLDPRQTVGEAMDEIQQVHFRSRGRAERRVRAEELLDAVGLGREYLDVRPQAMSGGQRQRVVIARALSVEPSVLVLDEAVSALDVSIQAQILNLLDDLRAQLDITYVFISHDLAVIRKISDTVLVLYRGSLMEQASAEELFTQSSHPYTQLLLDSVPRRGMPLLPHSQRAESHEGTGCLFRLRCAQAHDRCLEAPPVFVPAPTTLSRCWLAEQPTQ